MVAQNYQKSRIHRPTRSASNTSRTDILPYLLNLQHVKSFFAKWMAFALSRAIQFILSILGRASWCSSHFFLTHGAHGGVACVACVVRGGGASGRGHRGASSGGVAGREVVTPLMRTLHIEQGIY